MTDAFRDELATGEHLKAEWSSSSVCKDYVRRSEMKGIGFLLSYAENLKREILVDLLEAASRQKACCEEVIKQELNSIWW